MADIALLFNIIWGGLNTVVGNQLLLGILILAFFGYGLAVMRAPAVLWLVIGVPLVILLTASSIYNAVVPLLGREITVLGITVLAVIATWAVIRFFRSG